MKGPKRRTDPSFADELPDSLNTPRTVIAVLVFLVAFSAYLWTLAPTVVFVDSGELILAAKSLGVAHPPGFPLYVLLAHLATRIPVGNTAVRVNFASALFAALAVAFLFLLVAEITRSLPSVHDSSGAKKKRVDHRASEKSKLTGLPFLTYQLLPAIVAAMLFAFSRTLWSFATVTEVYTLNTFLISVIFYLLFRWRSQFKYKPGVRGDDPSHFPLLLASFLFGLALGVHHVSVAITLPALALLVYRTVGWPFFKSKYFLYAGVVSVAGLVLIYLYLPLAASRSPLMNWGDPRTVERFWWHISGRQYEVFLSASPQQVAGQFVEFLKLLAREFGPVWLPVGLALSMLGFVEIYQNDRTGFWFLVLVIACDLSYALNYEIAEDKGAYYLPAFIGLTVAAGFGARLLLRTALKWPKPNALAAASALILFVPIVDFAANFSFSNRRNFFLARDYINNIQSTIRHGGMLLTSDWQVYSPTLYFREVEQQRRDVITIDISLLRRSWYFDYLKQQYPDLIAANREKVEMFLADLRRWENDPEAFNRSAGLTRQINNHFFEMILAFVSTQMKRAPVYVTWEIGLGLAEDAELTQSLARDYQLIPQGLIFQLSTDRNFQMPADAKLETRGLSDNTFRFESDDVVMVKIFPVYANMLINRGKYLAAYGHYEEAIKSYQRALEIARDNKMALDSLADALEQMRKSVDEKR